ncbi:MULTISPECIES: STAS domain-containing protein [unclassified Micromonospora]|uniref:STAS domain-containing protein n=1 Tax=unclassified Micromonospora TaxID=2617518 RepID=UPI002FF1CE7B
MSTDPPYGRAAAHVPAPAQPLMSLSWEHEGPVTVVSVRGEIDMSNAHLLVDLATELGRDPAPQVVLDFSAVRFVDLHAVRALVEAHRLLRAAGGELTLRRPPRCVTRLLHLTGTAELFQADDGPRHPAARDGTAPDGATRWPAVLVVPPSVPRPHRGAPHPRRLRGTPS